MSKKLSNEVPGRKGSQSINRRAFLAGIGATSFLGGSGRINKNSSVQNHDRTQGRSDAVRVGLIGFGFRGEQLVRATKYAHPDWIEEQKNTKNTSGKAILEGFYEQEDLNIEYSGICDVYDTRLKRGIETVGKNVTGYQNYQELLSRTDIDAVIIASPDHWHAQMAIDAANAGKHVYVEKCMTRTAMEAKALREAVVANKIIFQLGHQGRQRDINHKAKELIDKGTLGKITLIETTTNRNNAFGAWLWPIDDTASPNSIDWQLFQGPSAMKVPFSPERFFRWRCWWDYGTGMAGDLLTHEYDAVNGILDLGIPTSAVASGGIYYYQDGREVPDVFHATYEYPDRELSLIYSGTLANGIPRGTLIMGHDATLELGRSMTVWADKQSSKYRSRIEAGIINPSTPMVRYDTGQKDIDVLTSATAKYFADRGLMFTYREGKRVNTTNLHLKEWLEAIRNGGRTSCNIHQGFQEAITAHLATISFKEGRKVFWDSENEEII